MMMSFAQFLACKLLPYVRGLFVVFVGRNHSVSFRSFLTQCPPSLSSSDTHYDEKSNPFLRPFPNETKRSDRSIFRFELIDHRL